MCQLNSVKAWYSNKSILNKILQIEKVLLLCAGFGQEWLIKVGWLVKIGWRGLNYLEDIKYSNFCLVSKKNHSQEVNFNSFFILIQTFIFKNVSSRLFRRKKCINHFPWFWMSHNFFQVLLLYSNWKKLELKMYYKKKEDNCLCGQSSIGHWYSGCIPNQYSGHFL